LVLGWFWQFHRVQSEWQQAQAALDRHDLDNASVHLDRYLKDRPGDPAAWFLAGRTARRLGNYSQAEEYLTKCQQIGGVTDATRLEWDLFRVQQGDLGDTDVRLRATVSPQHPDVSLVLEALARGYLSDGRLMDALEACELWVAQKPDDPWSWLWRGRLHERLVEPDQAITDYEQALRIAPHDRSARLALGALLLQRRQVDQAAEHFEQVLQRFPDDVDALTGLASCRIDQGQSARAMPLLEQLLAKDPRAAATLVLLGKAALDQGDARRAAQWLEKAVQYAPENIEASHQFILALRAQGEHAKADLIAPRLEALNRDITRFDWLTQAIARNPADAALRQEAGTIALRLGRNDDGVRWLQSALRCPGDHRPSHAALAEYFAQQNDPRAEVHRRLAQAPEE
jgi:tetratricopeptide (TPR) repeat protein